MSSGAEESVDFKKQAYFTKLIKLLDDYHKVFIVGVDNVGSNHMQKIRQALRGKGEVLMGKNVSFSSFYISIKQIGNDSIINNET